MDRTIRVIACTVFLLFTACVDDAVEDGQDSMSGHSDVTAVDTDVTSGDDTLEPPGMELQPAEGLKHAGTFIHETGGRPG